MSRRRRSTHIAARASGRLLVSLAMLAIVAVSLPAGVAAQEDDGRAPDIEGLWQLLEYRDANGDMTAVPPGIGATILPLEAAGMIDVVAACSNYVAPYVQQALGLSIQAPAEIDRNPCDAPAQAVDDALLANLLDARSARRTTSILTILDEVEMPLMTLTNARIPADPTIARWELARLGAADGSINAVIQGAEPWIEFLRGGRVVGSSGCGSFLGSWNSDDTTIRIQDVAYRLADCTDPVQRQAETIVETFSEVTDFKMLPAGLTLEDESSTTRLAFIPALDLENRTWTPVGVFAGDGAPLVPTERLNTSAVRFSGGGEAGVADGRSICRGFDGGKDNRRNLIISGLALTISAIQAVKGPCSTSPDDAGTSFQDVETAFLDALRRTASHALRGSELELLDADGQAIVRLVPQAELVGPTWVVTQMEMTPNGNKSSKRKSFAAPLTARFAPDVIAEVSGDTGASDNRFFGDYTIPGAAQIRIDGLETFGRACLGARANKPLCKQESQFLALLGSADGFIVREVDLRLFRGPRPLLWFRPDSAEPAEG